MWRISICILHVEPPNPWGRCVCVYACVVQEKSQQVSTQLACILSVCARASVCFPVNISGSIHALCGSLVYFSMQLCWARGLNNAQRDSKIEWMSVHVLLANFLCDLLHWSVPVSASCDTYTHFPTENTQNNGSEYAGSQSNHKTHYNFEHAHIQTHYLPSKTAA